MKIISKYIALLLVGVTFFASCKKNNAEYSVLRDHAFIAQTGTKGNSTGIIQVAESEPNGTTTEFNIRLSDIQSTAKKFKIDILSKSQLDAYNQSNRTNYVFLPTEYYKLSVSEATVSAGTVISTPIRLTVLPLTKEMIDSGNKYVVPIKLVSLDGMRLVNGGENFIYLVKPVVVTTVPVLGTDAILGYRKALAEGVTPVAMSQWTVEFRINMSKLTKNNQALFGSWGTGNSEIYIRYGDAATPFNTLQVKFAGSQFDKSNTVFEPNKWYHIAVVYNGATLTLYVNGKKDLDTDKIVGHTFNLGSTLHVASSGSLWFVAQTMMHELRIWNTARTPAQLIENEYSVSAKTPGLLHYWKMNEGDGTVFKNSIEGAPSLKAKNESGVDVTSVRWMDNVRSDNKTRTKID